MDENNITYLTDKGFNPNTKLQVIARLNLNKVIIDDKGIYTIYVYNKEDNKVIELQVNNIEIHWVIEDIQELLKTDMSQFIKILIG